MSTAKAIRARVAERKEAREAKRMKVTRVENEKRRASKVIPVAEKSRRPIS